MPELHNTVTYFGFVEIGFIPCTIRVVSCTKSPCQHFDSNLWDYKQMYGKSSYIHSFEILTPFFFHCANLGLT